MATTMSPEQLRDKISTLRQALAYQSELINLNRNHKDIGKFRQKYAQITGELTQLVKQQKTYEKEQKSKAAHDKRVSSAKNYLAKYTSPQSKTVNGVKMPTNVKDPYAPVEVPKVNIDIPEQPELDFSTIDFVPNVDGTFIPVKPNVKKKVATVSSDAISKNTEQRTAQNQDFDFFKAASIAPTGPLADESNFVDVPESKLDESKKFSNVMKSEQAKLDNLNKTVASNKAKSDAIRKGASGEFDGNLFGGFTTGDWIGMVSTVAGGVSEVMNTIAAAKATKQPVNRYLGFNEKSLRVNRKAQMESELNEQVAKRGLEREMKLKSNTLKSKLRGASTSISSLKAGDLAADYQTTEAEIKGKNELENIYGNQMLQLLGREEQLLSQQDQMEMSAQERVDIAEQQNLDNYYTNLATNIAGLSESGQNIGKNFNEAQYREDFLRTLPMMNKWGIGIKYTDGIPEMYTTKRNRAITEEGV